MDTQTSRRDALSIDEVGRSLGVSRSLIHKLIRAGTLRTVQLGDRRVVPSHELERLLSTSTEPRT